MISIDVESIFLSVLVELELQYNWYFRQI